MTKRRDSLHEVVNVVTTAWTTKKLKIELLATSLPNAIYEPDSFAGLVYHMKSPKSTMIMFASGRITSTGAKSIVDSKQSLHVAVHDIARIQKEHEIGLEKIEVVNVVVRGTLPTRVDLKKLAKVTNMQYSPETFPALIYRTEKIKSCLVFSTGKLILTGPRTEAKAEAVIREMDRTIKNAACYEKIGRRV